MLHLRILSNCAVGLKTWCCWLCDVLLSVLCFTSKSQNKIQLILALFARLAEIFSVLHQKLSDAASWARDPNFSQGGQTDQPIPLCIHPFRGSGSQTGHQPFEPRLWRQSIQRPKWKEPWTTGQTNTPPTPPFTTPLHSPFWSC